MSSKASKPLDLSAVCVAILDPEGWFAQGADIRVPASVPVLDRYDLHATIGWARLTATAGRIEANITLKPDHDPEQVRGLVAGLLLSVDLQEFWGDGRALIAQGAIIAVGLDEHNIDRRMTCLDGTAQPGPPDPQASTDSKAPA